MPKISVLARSTRACLLLPLLAIALMTSGCGGGESSASAAPPAGNAPPPAGNDPPPAAIEGVATPTSVAVVTATHAQ
jgi:hypothetical protein